MVTQSQINNFLSLKNIAVIGVSRDDKKFGSTIYRELKSKKNYSLFPIHKELTSFEGDKCYPDIKSLPVKPDGLFISTNKEKTLAILKDAHSLGIKNIWIQQMSETKEAIEYCKENNINAVYKFCLLMFLQPVIGFHNFHRVIKKIFGGLPK